MKMKSLFAIGFLMISVAVWGKSKQDIRLISNGIDKVKKGFEKIDSTIQYNTNKMNALEKNNEKLGHIKDSLLREINTLRLKAEKEQTEKEKPTNDNLPKNNPQQKNNATTSITKEEAPASRISFIVGIGGTYAMDGTYQLPIVSPIDNTVKIEKGQRIRINATLGIVYTPYIWKIKKDIKDTVGFFVAKGISFVTFFNPVSFLKNSNLEDNFNLANVGIGLGYKFAAGVGIYGVFEFYSVKQPRKWFVDEFGSGNKEYRIGGEIQHSFDESDKSIFRNKLIPSIGVKVCYSFDIVRNFAKNKE